MKVVRNHHAMVDRRGGRLEDPPKLFHPKVGIIVGTKSGAEYTGNKTGQIIRVDKEHLTKKERNRDKKLRRAANVA